MTGVTPAQLIAFCESIYEIEMGATWTNLEQASVTNAEDAAETGQRWALVSAANPLAQKLGDAENRARHAALQTAIDAAGCRCWPGRGRAADFSWVEDCWLVLAPMTQVDAWARAFEQHAVYLPPQLGQAAGLRIYSPPTDANRPPFMGNLRLEWVGCDPPFAT